MTGVVYFITVVGLTMFANLTTPAFAAQQDCIAEVNACQEANCPGGQGTTEEQDMACLRNCSNNFSGCVAAGGSDVGSDVNPTTPIKSKPIAIRPPNSGGKSQQ
jgi:hypothetical protein